MGSVAFRMGDHDSVRVHVFSTRKNFSSPIFSRSACSVMPPRRYTALANIVSRCGSDTTTVQNGLSAARL